MRKLILILFLFISFVSKAQVYQEMPQYGYRANRMIFDSTLSIPSTCGVPTLKSNITKKAAIAFDSCNNRFYQYNPKTLTWSVISGTSIDTSNQFVNLVTKLNDSTLRVIKGTSTNDLTITGVSYAKKLKTQVWNNTGITIPKGSVVYISGRHSSNLPTIALAEADNEANSYKTFALVDGDILDNSEGTVIQAGNISGLNLPTASYTDGDIVYLSPTIPGGITITKPLAPNHICKLGSVTRAHPTLGSIEVKIENGWQLDELSDIQIPLVPNDSTLLQFSRVDSLWHSVSVTNAIGSNYLKPVDSVSLSNRINLKLNLSDSATMLSKYLRKTDTATLSNRINLKVNISDTASMLSPYLRKIDTTNKFVNNISRIAGKDSIIFYIGSTRYAIKDSTGGGGSSYTFSTGLTNTSGTVTSNLSTGVSGGQSVVGGTAASNSLTLSSTSNATKGKLLFGTSAYDEVNNRLGIGTASPTYRTEIFGSMGITRSDNSTIGTLHIINTSTTGANNIRLGQDTTSNTLGFGWYPSGASAYRGLQPKTAYMYTLGGAYGLAFNTFNTSQPIIFCTDDWNERMRVSGTGNFLINTTTDGTYKLDVNGTARANQFQLSALNTAPASATATGTTGEIRIVNGFIYICVATNTWQRAAISTW